MLILKKFPEIKDWALDIMSNTLQFETELPYELGLIKQTSLFVKKTIRLKIIRNQFYWGTLGYDNTITIVERLEGWQKLQTIGHEVGHVLVDHHNDLYCLKEHRTKESFLIDKETGKEFIENWHVELEKQAQVYYPPTDFRSRENIVEILCDEIGIYFTQRVNKFNNLECYREICPDQLLLFSDDVLKALKK